MAMDALTPATDAPQPVFVLALPKTYTSVFGGMLGQHPGIMGTPELNMFVGETVHDWAYQPANDVLFNVFRDGLLRTLSQLQFGAQTVQTVQAAEQWLVDRQNWPIRDVFEHLRALSAPKILLDQSPIYTAKPAHILRILEAYPNAKFIHLVRNPTGWVKSMLGWQRIGPVLLDMYAKEEQGLNRNPDPVEIWHATHEGIAGLLSQLPEDQWIRVQGETVITDTVPAMRRVVEFLGLSMGPAETEEMMHPENSVFAGWGPPGARGGNNPDFLSDPRLKLKTVEQLPGLLKIQTDAMNVPPEALTFARELGYE
ncbi:MAG: hypothetical protein CMM86_07260 [Rhodovulum sp.]|nr:hypothetical protein [Rhodovulum sp.]